MLRLLEVNVILWFCSDGQFLAVLQENSVEVRYVSVMSLINWLILSLSITIDVAILFCSS